MLNKRVKVVLASIICIYCMYGAYLYYLSIICHTFFQKKANEQYSLTIKLEALQGSITDRNGMLFATNKETHTLYIATRSIKDRRKIYSFLYDYFPQAYQRLLEHPHQEWLLLQKNISDNEQLLITQAHIPQLIVLKHSQRWYNDQSCAPIIGIVNTQGKGLFGIEALYQAQLQGVQGYTVVSKEGRGSQFSIDQQEYQAPQQGACVQLTLDRSLQFLIFQEVATTAQQLKAVYAAALVINPKNGEIIAMVNYPSFDPNNTADIIAEHTTNRIATQAYEFGSIMKIVPLLGLLEENLIDSQEMIDCHSTKEHSINGVTIRTWKEHGLINFSQIVQSSNNIGIAKAALRLDRRLYEHYRRLGFGSSLDFNWPAQQKGFVNPPKKWSSASLFSLSFGYEVRATLLQLAHAWCILARRGTCVSLKLIKDDVLVNSSKQLYSVQTCQQAIDILTQVVSKGTAYRAQLKEYSVWGKTGTANLLIDGNYSKEHNIYTFAGVIEKENYQRLIITFVKDIGRGDVYASSVCVPLFKRIAELLSIHQSCCTV